MIGETVSLGEVCEILDTLRKPITKKFRKQGQYPYYGATGIVDYVNNYIFDETLVLIGEDGAKWDKGDQTAFIVSGKYWVNNHAHVIRPFKDKLNKKFLVYYLNSIDLKPWVTGLTVPKLNQKKLKSIPIPLFTIENQQRIVAKLDAAFAEIDNAIYAEEEKKNQIRPAFKSIYRDILYNRQSSTNNKKSLLGDISRVVGGNGFPKSYQGHSNKEIPFIKVSDMNAQGNEKFIYKTAHTVDTNTLKAIKAKAHEAGTLIFPKIGGAISTNKKRLLNKISAYDNNIVGVKPSDKLLPEYLHKIFKIIDIYELSNKAALPSINNPSIESIELFVPNLQEQSKIIEKLNLVDEHFTNLSDCVASKIHNFKLLKSTMIKHHLSPKAA